MGNPSIDAAINAVVLHQVPVTSTHVWIAVGIVVGLTIAAMVVDQLVNS